MTNEEREAMREYIDALVDLKVERRFAALDREALRGPAGPAGERGEKGEKGEPGADGSPGINGERGQDGARGEKGERGVDGRDGRDGKDGITERDMDAAVVRALEAILPSTVAAEVGRSFHEILTRNPIVTWKGVFKEGTEYQPGNMVQFGGNVFHCDKATTAKPDAHFSTGTKGDWTLAVKKGRDGKDAR